MVFTPYLVPSAVAGAILFILSVASLQFRKVHSAVPFAVTTASIAFWALCYTLEIAFADPGRKVLMAQMRFLGIGPMAAAWLVMCLHHAGQRGVARPGALALLAVEPIATAALSLTGSLHRLFRYGFRVDPTGPIPILLYTNGPFFWLHYVYMEGLFVTALVVLVRSLRGSLPWYRRQTVVVIAGTLLPLVTDLVFQIGVVPLHGYNLSTPVMAVSASLIALAIFRYRFLEIAPIARSIVVESMEDLMLVLDEQGRLVDFNPAAGRTLDLRHDADIGRPAPEALGWLGSALADAPDPEAAFLTVEGRGRLFDLSASPIAGRDGTRMGRMILLHDVTERIRIERELRSSEDRFRGLIEQSSEAILLTDEGGRIIELNPAAEKLMGRTRMEMLGSDMVAMQEGHRPAARREDGWADKARRAVEEALRTGNTAGLNRTREGVMVRPDGSERHFRQTAFPIRTPAGWRLGLVLDDVTEIRIAEEALRRSREDLAQAQKMDAIGRLAGGIAHDFNNLLTVIGGYAEVLEQELPDGSPARGDAAEIRAAAAKAAGLTGQLLAFGRKQVLEPRVLDLSVLVGNMEKMLRRLIGEDIELESFLQPGIGKILADPGKIEQVVMNLVVNARDAMPGGGRLMLRTQEAGATARHRLPEGRFVLLTVADTGVGMDAAVRERIFEPFFTTKEKGKGTGLGLATVYGVVSQSGGHVFCESAPQRGTRFYVYLPCAQETGAEPAVPAALPAAKGSGTILLVEDEDAVRHFIRGGLTKNGYRVLEAGDGPSALELLDGEGRDVHLLVTDVVMPRMSGGELARRVRERNQHVRVLFISGYADDLAAPQGWDGEVDFLQKPFTISRLLAKLALLSAGPPAGAR